jgi:hypothetical protein
VYGSRGVCPQHQHVWRMPGAILIFLILDKDQSPGVGWQGWQRQGHVHAAGYVPHNLGCRNWRFHSLTNTAWIASLINTLASTRYSKNLSDPVKEHFVEHE